MRVVRLGWTALAAALALVPISAQQAPDTTPAPERHLANLRQLTNGGENAEAYFSPDGTELIFQSTRPGVPCDQIFIMKRGRDESPSCQ